MKKIINYIERTFLNKTLDFHVRLFNILAMASTFVGIAISISGIMYQADLYLIIVTFMSSVTSLFLLIYATKSGHYKHCFVATIIVIFLGLYTVIFFGSGGSNGSMPYFFVFAIVFTVFMIEGKIALVVSALELTVYLALLIFSYIYPETVTPFQSELLRLLDLCTGLVIVCTALGVSLYIHFKLYSEQQKQLDTQNHVLEQINRNKTEFLSNISHELKTPLTIVSTHIQIGQQELEQHPELENLNHSMKLISGEIERLALMVSQILDISRIDEGRMRIDPRRENIIEIIQSALDIYYPVFGKNRNSLEFIYNISDPSVSCDRSRIIQVLVNLIGNASRHTREGKITLSVTSASTDVTVTISDTGEGIAPEQIPHLFERYTTRLSNTTSTNGYIALDSGTGLGLFICKHIVEMHGGRIWVMSRPHEGTEVSFTLPKVPSQK